MFSAGYPTANLTNAASRAAWIKSLVADVDKYYMDGVNVDVEGFILPNQSDISAALTSLVRELTAALRTTNPNAQVNELWHV